MMSPESPETPFSGDVNEHTLTLIENAAFNLGEADILWCGLNEEKKRPKKTKARTMKNILKWNGAF